MQYKAKRIENAATNYTLFVLISIEITYACLALQGNGQEGKCYKLKIHNQAYKVDVAIVMVTILVMIMMTVMMVIIVVCSSGYVYYLFTSHVCPHINIGSLIIKVK